MNSKIQAEKIAEAFAQDFLENEFGNDIFIGSHIEQLLDDKVNLIYQYTEDEKYYGAAVVDQSGEEFIALNTFQPLRMRYFTAAHELWHLSEGSDLQDESFDHERAADRFAAAIMLPKGLTKDLWRKFKKIYEPEEAVIHLADLASVPYEAVVRRLKELNERVSGLNLTEEEWRKKRFLFNLPDSLLDQAQIIEKFDKYEETVRDAVSEYRLDKLTAANKIGKYNPKLAEEWQREKADSFQEKEDVIKGVNIMSLIDQLTTSLDELEQYLKAETNLKTTIPSYSNHNEKKIYPEEQNNLSENKQD